MQRCPYCGAEIDDADPFADVKAKVRSHIENVHPEKTI